MTITWNRGGAVAALLLICTTGASAARADGAGTVDAEDLATADGRIYSHICQGCHMPQGQGAEERDDPSRPRRQSALVS
jgi:mono/diheme cytochrome c family protein